MKEFVERLIAEGDVVIASQWHPRGNYLLGPPTYVDLELFQQSRSRCRLLMSMLGTLADPWKPILASEAANKIESAKSTQGALKGVRQSLEEGLLIRFEDL
ncbi:MAG TPA: hypothetical protein VHE60_04295, partial [Pyrinomonadaceae bacterium]|nr:hypothetical protein [Pyrinomonadaceae bacterium]